MKMESVPAKTRYKLEPQQRLYQFCWPKIIFWQGFSVFMFKKQDFGGTAVNTPKSWGPRAGLQISHDPVDQYGRPGEPVVARDSGSSVTVLTRRFD